MGGGWLPKRSYSETFKVQCREDGVGKRKSGSRLRVQSEIRAFGIAEDQKATASEAKMWVETVTEGGRRFMAAWGKEEDEVNAARHRQEKMDATRLGNLLYTEA